MKLKKIRVTNFRSVNDSGEFDIDPVTCLVGKNESGKSALLLAIAALNPNESTPVNLDKERDYPRRNLVQYDKIHEGKEAYVIRTIWTINNEESQLISEHLGDGVLKTSEIEISKMYGEKIEINADLDCQSFIKNQYNNFALDAIERSKLGKQNTTRELINLLASTNSSLTEKQRNMYEEFKRKGDENKRLYDLILKILPTFMYFSSYDLMDGEIQIEKTMNEVNNNDISRDEYRGTRLFIEFLEYANIPIEKITQAQTYEIFNAQLQAASNDITDQILQYWSQNQNLEVEVRIDAARPRDIAPFNEGTIARARIKNNLHKVDTPFSERSAGFIWFFSFLVKFAQVKKAGGEIILLLDEPGLSLHGKAQSDLLRFIDEKLAPSHQVIYSTHSPFMVPGAKLERVRIIEDKVDKNKTPHKVIGTKVSKDVLQVDSDTLFPLQGALGYKVTQSLFVGKYTLLVEGPSDIQYLRALSNALTQRDKKGLDSRWTMCPAGGIDKMMPLISLFSGNDLRIAVLSDMARGIVNKVNKIINSDIMKSSHFFTIADFIDRDEGDIEDIFEINIYAEIVNSCYKLSGDNKITLEKLSQEESTNRVAKKVENLFRLMPETIEIYDHFRPADWLLRNPSFLDKESEDIDKTLERAEKIMETYNRLLDE